jgi:geranylgeranyl pyrophosphate synthase
LEVTDELAQIILDLSSDKISQVKPNDKFPAESRQALLGLSFKSAGGKGTVSSNLLMAWQLFMDAAYYFDSIEDQDTIFNILSGYKISELINGTTGLLILAYASLNLFLTEKELNPQSLEIHNSFYTTIIRACNAQARELRATILSLDEWWEIAAAKTGGPYSLVCWAGGRLASEDGLLADQLKRFGHHLGLMIQILDDAWDFIPGIDDSDKNLWGLSKKGLPISFALHVLPPADRALLQDSIDRVDESPKYINRIYELVQKCGASAYLETEIHRHRIIAREIMLSDIFSSPSREELISIVDSLSDLTKD